MRAHASNFAPDMPPNFGHTTLLTFPDCRGESAVSILKATALEDYDAAKDNLDWERIVRQVRRTLPSHPES
jgi:hypothetical protein